MASLSGLPAFHTSMRILLIGDSGVGKTCLLNAFMGEEFTNPLTTIGVDYRVQTLLLKDKQQPVKLQIWDTAGQERFQTITPSYYRNCNGVLLVYAADDPQSFERIQHWISQIETYSTMNPKVVIVGNKYDDEEKYKFVSWVKKTDALKLAQQYNLPIFFCSAKSKSNVGKPFFTIAEAIYETIVDKYKHTSINNPITNDTKVKLHEVSKPQQPTLKSKCCN